MASVISHVIVHVQWQTDKGISLLPKTDIFGVDDLLSRDEKVMARYNSKLLPTKVLFVGEKGEMEKQMAKIMPSPSTSTDSPKGRGHRAVKRKQLPEDFVSDVREESSQERSTKPSDAQGKDNLLKKAKTAAGHDIIDLLLRQRSESATGDACESDDDLQSPAEVEDIEDDSDDASVDAEMSKIAFLRSQNQLLKDKLDSSEEKVEQLNERIHELERNLLRGLPNIVGQLEGLVGQYRQVILSAATNNMTPPKHTFSQTSKQQQSITPAKPVSSRSSTPSSSGASSQPLTPASSVPSSPEHISSSGRNEEQSSVLDPAKVDKTMFAKNYGKLVCVLMRIGFSREEMATSSLTGKSKSGEARNKLDPVKVEEMIRLTTQKFGVTRTAVRTKMAEKMKDKRKAFFQEGGEQSLVKHNGREEAEKTGEQ